MDLNINKILNLTGLGENVELPSANSTPMLFDGPNFANMLVHLHRSEDSINSPQFVLDRQFFPVSTSGFKCSNFKS